MASFHVYTDNNATARRKKIEQWTSEKFFQKFFTAVAVAFHERCLSRERLEYFEKIKLLFAKSFPANTFKTFHLKNSLKISYSKSVLELILQ